MKIAKVQFTNCKIDDTQFEELRVCIIPFFDDTGWKRDSAGDFYWWHPWIVDLDLMPHWVKYTVEARWPDKAVDLTDAKTWEGLQPRPEPPVNTRINVAIGGLGLLAINEVMVEYDMCTDALRVRLKDGWRIIAVCPQPNQRRPDYVLGRSTDLSS